MEKVGVNKAYYMYRSPSKAPYYETSDVLHDLTRAKRMEREFGQKISNWVRGQLGEIGLKYFCNERLGIDIELDFDMHDKIGPNDVFKMSVTV